MPQVTYVNTLASHIHGHVLYIVSPEIGLMVSSAFFNSCFSEKAGCAIHFTSGDITVENVCALNCSSLVTSEEEPGGALMHIIHKDSEQYNVVLNMISTSKTPDTTSTYSSISMSYGIIKYSYINTTYNKATCDPSLYVLFVHQGLMH